MKTTWRIILKDIFGTLSSVGAWLRPCSKASGACLLPFYLFTLLPLLSSCSGDDDGGGRQGADDMQTVRLYLNVPSSQASRAIGDPGEATGEGEDWDRLAVMIEAADGYDGYIVPGSRYYVEILSKEDFNRLDEESGSRWLPIDLIEGSKVRIYGVTYSDDVNGNPEAAIEGVNSGTYADLEISNDYSAQSGNIDVAKFLSVATGYYEKDGNRVFTVKQPESGISDRTNMPTMTLTRLAAKIDIQWDAEDAYPNYTNVRVTDFKFYNNKGARDGTENNQGCLFPSLHEVNNADGHKTFYNTTEISQRNGRVYHYAFPNGSNPELRFNVTADGDKSISCKYEFTQKLQKATWYKLNVTIKGLSHDVNEEITFEGPQENSDTGI